MLRVGYSIERPSGSVAGGKGWRSRAEHPFRQPISALTEGRRSICWGLAWLIHSFGWGGGVLPEGVPPDVRRLMPLKDRSQRLPRSPLCHRLRSARDSAPQPGWSSSGSQATLSGLIVEDADPDAEAVGTCRRTAAGRFPPNASEGLRLRCSAWSGRAPGTRARSACGQRWARRGCRATWCRLRRQGPKRAGSSPGSDAGAPTAAR